MNYPLISEYVEAIMASDDTFNELSYLRPVLDASGQPMMTSGGFAVVFKMKDEQPEGYEKGLYARICESYIDEDEKE